MSETPEQIAANLAAQFEGFSAVPYLDPGDVVTQGYGSTFDENGDRLTMEHPPISAATGLEWLARDMGQAVLTIANYVTVPLTCNQKAALSDMAYNVGSGAFVSSTLLHRLNLGDYAGAAAQLLVWNHENGVILPGLTRRCSARLALFNTPESA
jgi:lysozyme